MRPYYALLGLLLLFGSLSCGRSIDATTGDENAADVNRVVKARPGSKAKVIPNARYDFGTMEAGEVGKHTFTITSVGEEPLEVKQGKTTCKCTVSGLSAGGKKVGEKDSLILKKGESASIELEWEPKGNEPMFSQSATIHTSDPDQPQIPLTIVGQVTSVMMLQPMGPWIVGSVDGEKPAKFDQFMIGSAILKEFKITSITCPDKSIEPRWEPLSKADLQLGNLKSGYKIIVTVRPKDTLGRFDEKLTIKTDARKGLTFTQEISGVRTGPVLIRPAPGVAWDPGTMKLSLGRFQASKGNSAELMLYVGGLGEKELKITKVEKGSDDHLSVELKKVEDPEAKTAAKSKDKSGRRKVYRLAFTVPPGKEPVVRTASQTMKVTLHTNHPRMKTMALSVSFISF